MQKIIFIDRDGTLIQEPLKTFQVNSLQELEFLPFAISSLQKLVMAGFTMVFVSNQDGLGTEKNPLENYENINGKIIQTLRNEGIEFFEMFTCPHYETDGCVCRKPKTGMVDDFLKNTVIDFDNSYMVGDRETDMIFAKNIGVEGLFISSPSEENNERKKYNWKTLTSYILEKPRTATVERKTNETEISVSWNLDGNAHYSVDTGLKFFDHMLEQLGKHGNFDLNVLCKGDLEIDEHHTIEDVALALGSAFKKALGDKRGIIRYADDSQSLIEKTLPMDESLARVAIDISGRSELVFSGSFSREYVGDFPTEMLKHFYKSFCDSSGVNMNMKLEGENTHHMVEISFKAFARCLQEAVRKNGNEVSSTKGVL